MTQNKSYLFYDIETTGLNPCFDQILQFAAIRTDLDLKELDRYEINVRLNTDVIPSPYATITHRIGIEQSQSGLAEIEAMQQIYELINQPETISVGYNTLGFDDEFLRFAFYRNLLPPYTHQWANGCSRMDIYPMTVMYYLYKNQALKWPNTDGKTNLKLENLSELNQLAQGQYHNAMVDVEATLALARKLMSERNMWDYLLGYFNKQEDEKRQQKLPTLTIDKNNYRHAVLVYPKFGADANYQSPVIGLGSHTQYKNQNLWLRLDTEELRKTRSKSIEETTWVVRKKGGEQELLLPPTRFLRLDEERIKRFANNLAWLQQNPDIFADIRHHYQNYCYPTVPNIDIDSALYELSFPKPNEEAQYKEFLQASANNKLSVLKKFSDKKRQQLALRLMGRHYPDQLPNEEQQQFQAFLKEIKQDEKNLEKIPVDFRGNKKYCKQQALADIKQIEKDRASTLDQEQIKLLNELREYLD